MALPNSGITTTLVKQTLEENSNSVTVLCKSSKINQNSLYKPVDYNKTTGLTEADYFDCNFGFSITSKNNFSSLKQQISSNTGWYYNRPKGGISSPCRIGDFRKYDHNAKELFPLTLDSSFRVGDILRIRLDTDIMWLTNWKEWSGYKGTNIQYLNLGFYVPTVGYFPLTDTNQGLGIDSLDMGKLSVDLSTPQFTSGKTYSIYLILTTWDGLNGPRKWYNPSDTEGGIWWYLPSNTPASFTTKAPATPFDYVNVYGEGTANMDMYNGYYRWTNVQLNINVKVASNYAYNAGTLLIEVIIPNHYSGTGTSTSNKTIYSTTLTGIVAGYSKVLNVSAQSFNLLISREDFINANLNIKLTVGSTNYTKNSSLTITSNGI